MKILIASCNMVDLSTVKVKRTDNAHVELSTSDVLLSAHDDTWRAIIKRVQALLDAPKPKHPGWVFVDEQRDVWGWIERLETPGSGSLDARPFITHDGAKAAAMAWGFKPFQVREWRASDHVPPMPEDMEGVP